MKIHVHMTAIASMILESTCDYGSCNRIIEAKIELKEMKNRLPDKLILGHLNINS